MDFCLPVTGNDGIKREGDFARVTGLSLNDQRLFRHLQMGCPELGRFWATNGASEIVLTKPPQSFKTKVFVYYAVSAMAKGRNVLIVVENQNAHGQQLTDSINDMMQDLLATGRDPTRPLEERFEVPCVTPVYVGSLPGKDLACLEFPLRRGGALIVCLDNDSQLSRVRAMLEKTGAEVDMVHDESDGTLKRPSDKEAKRDQARNDILTHTGRYIRVTATPMSHFLCEGDAIMTRNLINAKIPDGYVGLEDPLFQLQKVWDQPDDHTTAKLFSKNAEGDERFPQPWFQDTIAGYATGLPDRVTNEPHDVLVKISDRDCDHHEVQDWLAEKYPTHPSIVDNSYAFRLYFPGLLDEPRSWLSVDAGYEKKVTCQGVEYFCWKNTMHVSYPEMKTRILDLYESLGKTETFFEIMGRKADRGVRFLTTNRRWSPSGMVYIPAGGQVQFMSAYQAAGRIMGVRGADTDVKYLSTTDRVVEVLKHGYELQNSYLANSACTWDKPITELIKSVVVSQEQALTRMTKQLSVTAQKRMLKYDVDVPAKRARR